MKHYSPTGRRNHGRPLKRLLDAWVRNGSTSGPTPWQIYDDDDYGGFNKWHWSKFHKTNEQIAKELKITPILDKLLEYKRSWIQHVNRMPRNTLPGVMKHYCPTGRRNHGRPLKRLRDTWVRNGSTSGQTPWRIWWWWWYKTCTELTVSASHPFLYQYQKSINTLIVVRHVTIQADPSKVSDVCRLCSLQNIHTETARHDQRKPTLTEGRFH